MNLYSHTVLAAHLEPLVGPEDPAEYAWGAIAPDIRYMAGMRRDQTHLPLDEVRAWMDEYLGCRSFAQGYWVHLLLDSIDLQRGVGGVFPLNLIRLARRKDFSYQQLTVLIEFYFLETAQVNLVISGAYNPILERLGLSREIVGQYASMAREYGAARSMEKALAAFQQAGLLKNGRIDGYLKVARGLQKNVLLKRLLVSGVRRAGMQKLAVAEWNKHLTRPPDPAEKPSG